MRAASPQLDPANADREIASIVIDSREVGAGDVFFALSQPDYANNGFNGEFEDATKYCAASFENGAAACVVRHDRFEEHRTELEPYLDRLVFVDDTIRALQNLARGVYLAWNKPVVAITGSAGKTTAKELAAHVLSASGKKVLKNIKNYNNGLGHPLTVLNLAKDDTYDLAVLEMGMSTPMHEIERLCGITPPDIAVVLNVLPVHVEHLGSIENVAKAKAEIVEGMKEGGTAVLNADDERVIAMAGLAKGPVVSFGIESPADVLAANIRSEGLGNARFELITPKGTAPVDFHLDGVHNIYNALAAAGSAHALGMGPDEIAAALSSAVPPPQRGQVLNFAKGFTVINDSYNSNPDALISMIKTLVDSGAGKRKIVVAGEMLELGADEAEIHRRTGQEIAALGVDKLIGVRGLAEHLVEGARSGGLEAEFMTDSDAAADALSGQVREDDLILIKGSRGVRTEKIVERLAEDFELAG
ncbi:MAG: UDP-N-acetylmuramoyl-tripeptide--D-alanyl-D-alanine ligase [Pyrinomonadaceae bacterium]